MPAAVHARNVDLEDGAAREGTVVALPAGRPVRTRRVLGSFALAASAAGVAMLAGLLWAGFPRDSLAADVVAHMAHEPQAWSTRVPLLSTQTCRHCLRFGS